MISPTLTSLQGMIVGRTAPLIGAPRLLRRLTRHPFSLFGVSRMDGTPDPPTLWSPSPTAKEGRCRGFKADRRRLDRDGASRMVRSSTGDEGPRGVRMSRVSARQECDLVRRTECLEALRGVGGASTFWWAWLWDGFCPVASAPVAPERRLALARICPETGQRCTRWWQ